MAITFTSIYMFTTDELLTVIISILPCTGCVGFWTAFPPKMWLSVSNGSEMAGRHYLRTRARVKWTELTEVLAVSVTIILSHQVCRCNRKGLFDTASCEYLFFCQPILAEEAYKLLTSNVATRRHHEAAEYLESYTRQTKRCSLHEHEDFFQYDETG